MERREEVYEKALELFTAEGYHATSLSRVAEELGLAQASLYHYFSSKKELLFLVYERCLKRDLVPIIESARKIKDPDKRILYLTREYTKANIERGASSRVLVREAGKLKPEHQTIINQIWRRFFDLIENSLSELKGLGKSKQISRTFAASALLGMCIWTSYWFDPEQKEATEELSDTYAEIFFRGILKD